MDEIQRFLAQPTTLGVTVGQIVAVCLGAAGVVIALSVVSAVLNLAGNVLRMGCVLIFLFGCGCAGSLVVLNLLNRVPR